MTSLSDRSASTLWIMLLTAASLLGSWALACAAPFEALATLAALNMRRRDGIALMLLVWAANQAVGFGILGYPHDPKTLTWGLAIGSAAVASLLAARAAANGSGVRSTVGRMAVAYIGSFVAFKAVIALWALGLGGLSVSLSPKYALDQFALNGAFLIGLFGFYRGLVALGAPRAAPLPQIA